MKKYSRFLRIMTLIVAIAAIMFSCVDDEFDTPTSTPIAIGDTLTIQQVKNLYNLDDIDYTFTTDASVFAVVTMDDKNGNIYKTAFIQDNTGAIALHFDASGGLYQGDSIRIQLNGLKVGKYQELFQIDALNGNGFTLDKYITKLQTSVEKEPETATISEINNNISYYQGRLVKLENVQFSLADTSKTYADAVNQESKNRVIEDFNKNIMLVRTSGYAEIADQSVADGSGYVVAIVGQYDDDLQLYLRSKEEILMDGERHWIEYTLASAVNDLTQDFETGAPDQPVSLSGWINHNEEGRSLWTNTSYSGNTYAEVGAYKSGLDQVKTWLVLPQLNIGTDYALSFQNAIAYWEHGAEDKPLKVVISTDFTGIIEQATWTELEANFADYHNSNYEWVSSGNVDLRPYEGQVVSIAFVYEGSDSQSTTAIIDDVRVDLVQGGFGQEIFKEEFETGLGNFSQYSVLGTEVWHQEEYSNNGYAYCNGYPNANEDWLFTPEIDLSSYTSATLNFTYALGYLYTGMFDDISVLVSSDYSGTDDPSSATWVEKSFTHASETEWWDWTDSGSIDISEFAGESNVYIAFRYVSSSTESCAWEVDNVQVKAE